MAKLESIETTRMIAMDVMVLTDRLMLSVEATPIGDHVNLKIGNSAKVMAPSP